KPHHPTPTLQPHISNSMNNPIIRTIPSLILACLIAACGGPDEAALRSELQAIESEMLHLEAAALEHQARVNDAEAGALLGTFAAGYGTTSGDIGLAADGA